ncbi:hypothetical protein ACP70R_003591 [Stipagrostis hirtigluma subsp. patula]
MESDLLHGNGKKPRRRYCSTTAVTLLLFLLTNTISIVVSSGAGPSLLRRYRPAMATVRLWDGSAALLADLNATQSALDASRAELTDLHARVGTANELLRTLLAGMARDGKVPAAWARKLVDSDDDDGWAREPAGELKLAVGPHRLADARGRSGAGEVAFPALGHACRRFQDDLERYMSYTPGGECPSDEPLEHRLMVHGCEPLPRRRCRPRSPKGYVHPTPLLKSLWSTPPDTSVVWDAYRCKNYSCLAKAAAGGGDGGCDGCSFDLRRGREKDRWERDDGALSYSIDAVLRSRPPGTVRIGLDLGGGGGSSGTFAARMLERGVTVVTASVNPGAPFGGFIASRGLVPVHVTAGHRLPFFDGTLDVVRAADGLAGRVPGVALEFALFDVYRVLRPGGLLWLDHFVCAGEQLNATCAPVIGRVGFKKLRWNTRRKPGRGKAKTDGWYISALLEKPMA